MPREPTGQIREYPQRDGSINFSVRFRGKGFPRGDIVLGSSAQGMTRARAEEEARIIRAQIRAGTWIPKTTPKYDKDAAPSFAQLAAHWYALRKADGLKPNTLADLRNRLEVHLIPFFGGHALYEIDDDAIAEYRMHKAAENDRIRAARDHGEPLRRADRTPLTPLSNESINKQLRTLARILDGAVKRGHLSSNPARGEGMRLPAPRIKHPGLELDEVLSLLEAARNLDRRSRITPQSDALRERIVDLRDGQALPWKEVAERAGVAMSTAVHHYQRKPARSQPAMPARRTLIAVLVYGGLRVSEACALNLAHIDLAHLKIRVLDAKTPRGVREVDIHPPLLDELTAYFAALGDNRDPEAPAFPTATGSRRDRNNVNKRVIIPVVREANRLRARQGLPPIGRHVTPHTLRKTYITLLLEADAPVSYVQAQVGHLSSKTTLEIYAYVLSRKQRGEVGRKIELILGQAANPSSVDGRLPIPSSSEYALSAPSEPR